MRLAVVGVAGLLAVAVPGQSASHADLSPSTIRLIAKETRSKTLVDRPPLSEPSSGDVYWAKATLRNAVPQFGRPKGAIVGSGVGTVTFRSSPSVFVRSTATLPNGTLRVAGVARAGEPPRIPVVGGTGTYAGARGTCETRSLGGGRALNVCRLRLP